MKRREIFRSELGHSPTARLAELLARYRVRLTEERDRVHNRIHKVLEDACIQAIIRGQEHPDWLADYAKGKITRQSAGTAAGLARPRQGSSSVDAARTHG